MDDQSFDSTLRDFVRDSSLPFEEGAWEQMSRRLRAEPVLSAGPKRRRIPIYLYRASAAAIAGLLMLTAWLFWLSGERGMQPLSAGLRSQSGKPPAAAGPVSAPARGDKNKSASIDKGVPALSAAAAQKARISPDEAAPAPVAPAPVQSPFLPDSGTALVQSPVPSKAPGTGAHPSPDWRLAGPDVLPGDDGHLPRRFDVAGGYNLGSERSNFTLGVNVQQPLGSRFVLDAGLAMVSGNYESYRTVQTTIHVSAPPGSIGPTSIDSVVESQVSASGRLLYLQAAPSLSYRIYKGFSAGAGVDAQRLLNTAGKAGLVKQDGSPGILPEWDFGLTGRLDVQVTKRLRTGLMYRESIRAQGSGAQVTGRSYLLVQLGYSLF